MRVYSLNWRCCWLCWSLACVLALSLSSVVHAGLAQPQGPVILKVSGQIAHTNVDDEAHFDRDMLAALEQKTVYTHTPWHDGIVEFRGPLGKALIDAVGANGQKMRVIALNDYAADVPVADFYDYDVILAMKIADQPLSVRKQGPLFLIYPFDEYPELLKETYLIRSVWQVSRIVIE